MKTNLILSSGLLFITESVTFYLSRCKENFKSLTGKKVNDFILINTNGIMTTLNDFDCTRDFVIVFISKHCPFAKLYREPLNVLNATYKAKGVLLIAISSTDPIHCQKDSFKKINV